MQDNLIESYVEEPWGSAAIFSTGPRKVNDLALVATDSEVIQAMSMLQTVVEEESLHTRSISPRKCLKYFVSSLFATIVEDALIKLRILMECNNELRIMKTASEMKSLLVLKFGVILAAKDDELEGVDPNDLECEQYKINKLDADKNFVAQTMITTYIDLCVNRSYDALETAINKIVDRDNYRDALLEEEAKNKLLRRDLNKQLRQQRNHIKSSIYEISGVIDHLRDQVEDSGIYTNCRSRYIENWQRARTEQHIQTIHDIDVVTTEVVEYYKRKFEHEQRVHSEVDLLINIIINETLEKIENWMAKYDNDMEKLDLKIRLKKNDYQNMKDKRIGLEKTIEDHDIKMKEWCEFKDIREKARLYREKMTNSAIIVQAWWRGLLVRRNLGPYKVEKKGKRGKK